MTNYRYRKDGGFTEALAFQGLLVFKKTPLRYKSLGDLCCYNLQDASIETVFSILGDVLFIMGNELKISKVFDSFLVYCQGDIFQNSFSVSKVQTSDMEEYLYHTVTQIDLDSKLITVYPYSKTPMPMLQHLESRPVIHINSYITASSGTDLAKIEALGFQFYRDNALHFVESFS